MKLNDAALAVVHNLLQCVCSYVERDGGGPTCWCGPNWGDNIVANGCGDCGSACGSAFVNITGLYPADGLGVPANDLRCDKLLVMQLLVGTTRCYPVVGVDGGPADPDEMLRATGQMFADMSAVREALRCCLPDDKEVGDYVVLGADGGCAAAYWNVEVLL